MLGNGLLVDQKTPNLCKSNHRRQPTTRKHRSRKFQNIKLLDPFAGFGSIPLEALRLGIDTTAV